VLLDADEELEVDELDDELSLGLLSELPPLVLLPAGALLDEEPRLSVR
jgi:hypothetical protein